MKNKGRDRERFGCGLGMEDNKSTEQRERDLIDHNHGL